MSLSCNSFGNFNVDLSNLPPKLESLDLSKNQFRSSNLISFKGLPSSLRTLILHSNDFSSDGEITIRNEDEDQEEEEEDDLHQLTTLDARWCPNLHFSNEPPEWVRI